MEKRRARAFPPALDFRGAQKGAPLKSRAKRRPALRPAGAAPAFILTAILPGSPFYIEPTRPRAGRSCGERKNHA